MNFVDNILPIFIIIIIGFSVGRWGFLRGKHYDVLEYVIFRVAAPCGFFNAAIKYGSNTLMNKAYISTYIISFALLTVISFLILRKKHTKPSIIIKAMSSTYTNTILYGLPVLMIMFNNISAAVIVGIINMAILQAMAIILLEITTTQHKWQQVVYRIFRVLLSPMVVLPITGMLVSHFNIAIPKFIITTTQNIASPISGLSLFTFGLSISNGLTIKREHITHDFISAIVIKSLIHPVVAGLIGYFIFNLSRYWLASTIILTAAPTALVVSFIAKQYDLDSLFVRRVIVVQSVISLVTIIPIFIFMM